MLLRAVLHYTARHSATIISKSLHALGLIALLRDIGVSDVRRRDDEHRER